MMLLILAIVFQSLCSWTHLNFDSRRNPLNPKFGSRSTISEWNITLRGYFAGGNLVLDEDKNLIYFTYANISGTPNEYSDTFMQIDADSGRTVGSGVIENIVSFGGSLTNGGLHFGGSNYYIYLKYNGMSSDDFGVSSVDIKKNSETDWLIRHMDNSFSLNRIVLDSKGNAIMSIETEPSLSVDHQSIISFPPESTKPNYESSVKYPCLFGFCDIVVEGSGDEETIYVVSCDGNIYHSTCNSTVLKFSAKNGSLLNSFPVRNSKYWFVSGVTVSHQEGYYYYLVVHDNDNRMHVLAFEKGTDKQIFDTSLPSDSEFNDCSPLILTPDEKFLRFSCSREVKGSNYVYSVNSLSGKVEWSREINKNEEECFRTVAVGMKGETIVACGIKTTPKLYVFDDQGKELGILSDNNWEDFYEGGVAAIDSQNFLYYCVGLAFQESNGWTTLCSKRSLDNF